MGLALLEPGSVIIDYSWNDIWATDPAAIPAAGISGVCRYVSYDDTKDMHYPEVQAHDSVGTLMILNFEASTTGPMKGYAQGYKDGQKSRARALELGYPTNMPIIFSVDFEIQPSQYQTFVEYITGALDGMEHQWPAGVYGHARLMDFMAATGLVTFYWQCSAWSYGARSDASDMLQLVGNFYPDLGATDKNVALHSVYAWRPGLPDGVGPGKDIPVPQPPAPPEPPEEDDEDMPPLFFSPDQIFWPGSHTLARGEYPPNNGIWFASMPDGRVRHVTYQQALRFYYQGPVHLESIPGADLGQMIREGGVFTLTLDGEGNVSPPVAVATAPEIPPYPVPPTSFQGTLDLNARTMTMEASAS